MATGRDEWVEAAYERFAEHGLAAVRVEPLAAALGTTKGSFYWHFSSRAELIAAVMERWEERETLQAIDVAEASGPPAERLAALFQAVASRARGRQGEATLYVEAVEEGVMAAVERVSQRRIDYIAGLLVELGLDPQEAQRRGVVCLAMVLGLQQLGTGTSGSLTAVRDPELARTALAMALAV